MQLVRQLHFGSIASITDKEPTMAQIYPTSTLDSLDSEWERSFAQAPVLNGTFTCAQLVDQLNSATPAARDAQLLAIIRQAQGRDRAAQHVVLRIMRSAILSIATKRMPLRKRPHGEAVDSAIAAMLETIAIYPTDRWLSHVTTNLVRKTAARLVAEDTGWDSVDSVCVDGEQLAILEEMGAVETEFQESAEASIATVLSWALETGTLTREEVRIMATWELGDAGARARLSTETGCSQQALRQRSYRLRRTIHEAVQAHIASVGSW